MALQRAWLVAAAAACLLLALPASQAAVSSVVANWFNVAQSCITALGVEHQQAARLYATLASAQYDAIKAAQKSTVPISEEAAAAYASHFVMSTFFIWRQSYVYDPVLAEQIAALKVSDADLAVLKSVLVPVVKAILNKRLCDGSSFFANFKPGSSSILGLYQFTPDQTTVHYPQVANANGFFLANKDVDAFTAKLKHFTLSDAEYAKQLQETFSLGSVASTSRTEYDTGSVYFWSQGNGTSTLAGFWIGVALEALPASTPLIVQARFLKLLTTSFWDTAVACWRVKFREQFWRPITAIRTEHGAGVNDPTWTPLLTTPIDPEYVSSHMCTSGAALYVLESHLGATTSFSAASLSAPDLGQRSYASFLDAVLEVGMSRIYAGVHFRKSNEDGMALGYAIAKKIHTRFFKGANLTDVF
ncbi:hypothetical protein Vretimale_6655 [Volvox reticuliferus]|uniref:Uncharacterized protein n=1 Tax=Volvox reticuliferus TaxID=1737510 RepID=A0A8J4C8Q7_9CHLO|nr:hypothetical protein Vretifemale_7308 [Volvox reticuliferus]GIM01857.1 hypothetical protein Vretimale_6655 [Volvox reticuliferus]